MEINDDSNEQMSVNSDSDSDSGDDQEEQALLTRAEDLERQISDNKYLYNAHEELVNLYRKLGDLKSMRLAYERFQEYFPLTPEIWLAWINDEKKLASSESEIKNIFGLFDKAVEDYLSVNLWVEYAQYSIGVSTLDTTRVIIERGLTAAGLHVADGSLLWDTLRELEFAHLSLTEAGSEPWKTQVEKIVEVFRRQLSVPLLDMENTYKEWKEWLTQVQDHKINAEPVEWGYNKALKTLETYKPFEEKLQVTTDESQLLRVYRDYVKVLTDPSTILCLYERATAQMCLNPEIWLDYCLYGLKLGAPAEKITTKALRNCPWSQELWIMRLQVLESLQKDNSEVVACFEQAVSNLGAQSSELWLAYLEYVSRTCQDQAKVFKSFDQALEQLKYNDEGALKITKWYSRILAKNNNMQGARNLWKNLLKSPNHKILANTWLEYARLERQFGEPPQVRAIFQKALTNCTDWPLFIADEWREFEREFGKLPDVLKCLEKRKEIEPKLKTIEPPKATGTKRKHPSEAEPPPKKHKKQAVVKDPTRTIFVSNLHTSVNEKRLRKFFPNCENVEIVVDKRGKSRCYGYVQFALEESVMAALARDRELLDGRPIFISNCKPNREERKAGFKYSNEPETNKLFVKGLPYDKSQEEIEAIFRPFGAKTVRLVCRRDGKPKGLAYVEFEDDASAKKAMEKTDGMTVGDFTISVAISAPPVKKPTTVAKSTPTRHARSRLQVPMLPRSLQVKSATNGDVKPKTNDDFRLLLQK
ncbi:squamous cell carcinoma antigen recognized by T-cells 3 [Tribolium castaneum]|uniref:Squamous cell carcinoma antigen recognized by T-cells 3-like Protein n=1 Tax=Tribolium castaneum TaxID=7070 RepID=D6WTB8_TRICA|nr:PREDICTED: squamous cell carcinoma antigen recognized by T-cells 3 [Tribolium castaneum]EFA06313.2 Squamous cell carcinoma antigen recognized by T-cells 3-like Protein [Tribolium castaneum]|eukprot:XP_972538.1 PREDICTED: squamous cell carcinoma antigen recognized by T-cells 3 [Tribolium castaneum]